MTEYYQPIVNACQPRPAEALPVAGGWGWFTHAYLRQRGQPARVVSLQEIPEDWRNRLSAPRAEICGMDFDKPHVMGILNVTPDSFSDGGQHANATQALTHARDMVAHGVSLIDVGGESTRPGAQTVPVPAEIARIQPVIQAIRHEVTVPLSIDTRKSAVADVAVRDGANIVNDVSGFTYDPMLGHFCKNNSLPVCIMHAKGDPETMQDDPQYDDVLLDVYDFLAGQVAKLENMGIARGQMIVDPGIGFGKTINHNLMLLNNISLFHGLGCVVLLGASRKKFIGTLSNAPASAQRMPGSVATALNAIAQGVQIVRVHDTLETCQAIAVWMGISKGEHS
jgi:dihydropteroate synthase